MSIPFTILDNNAKVASQIGLPYGLNLTNPATRTLTPVIGCVAYDNTTSAVTYAGTTGAWTPLLAEGDANNVTIGAFSATGNNNGASITTTGQVLTLHPATITQPGAVSTATQSFLGLKTFSQGIAITNMATGITAEYNIPTQGIFWGRQSVGGDLSSLAISGNSFSTQTTVAWSIQKMGRQINLAWSSSISIALTGASHVIETADGVIPVEFRPATARVTRCNVDQAGTISVGYVLITTTGKISWGASILNDTPAISPLLGATGAIVDDCVVFLN